VRAQEIKLELCRLAWQVDQLAQSGNLVAVAPIPHSFQFGGEQTHQVMSSPGVHTLGGAGNYCSCTLFDLRDENSSMDHFWGPRGDGALSSRLSHELRTRLFGSAG